jgi:uncharacterized protein (DUF305 family)
MDRKLLIYSLAGLFAGSVVTALVTLSSVKAAPKATLAGDSTTAQVQPTFPQSSPSGSVSPIVPGMMGQSDQHFIVMMIPHHEGAVAMADLALSRARHPELKKLAQTIKTTQTNEIQQMRAWYKQWYSADVPAWGPGRGWGWYSQNQLKSNNQPIWGPGMGMYRNWDDWNRQGQQGMMGGGMMGGGMMGGGMMGGTNLYALQNAPDFDREFIQQMIPHHQMGVMMASMVLNSTQRPEIRTLAQSIIRSQTAEINQMQQWYQQWYQ